MNSSECHYTLDRWFCIFKARHAQYLHRIALMKKLSILAEFWNFLKVRKKFWLAPIIIVLMLLGLLIVLTEGTALAPFIYTLF